jgi:hypothetical protein
LDQGGPQTELLKNQLGRIPKDGKKCYPNLYFLEKFGKFFETSLEILLLVIKQAPTLIILKYLITSMPSNHWLYCA